MRLRARLYDGDQKPHPVLVITRCKLAPKYVGPQYPYAESILAESRIQPYIHNCIIMIQEHCCTHCFFLQVAHSIVYQQFLANGEQSRYVWKCICHGVAALEPSSVVNMRGSDARLSDWMIGR